MMAVLGLVQRPQEGLRFEQAETALWTNRVPQLVGTGTLYVTTSVVCWIGEENKGIILPYTNIILHAVHRNSSAIFPGECLYLHTDAELPWPSESDDDSDGDDTGGDDCSKVTPLYFVPQAKETINDIYTAIADCQALNPDVDDFSPDEEYETFPVDAAYTNGGDVDEADERLAALGLQPSPQLRNGLRNPQPNNDILDEMDEDCFEDAEEDI